jgi:ComF family protein
MLDRFLDWSFQLAHRLPSAIPSSCALCGISGDNALCKNCNTQFFTQHRRRCTQCGLPMPEDTTASLQCGECLQQTRAFDATLVASNYAAPVDHLVLALKFGNRLALAPLFARLMQEVLQRELPVSMPDLLTVVPLGDMRLAERGFNQALEIARPLAQALAIPLAPRLLARTRDTLMQAQLHPDERHRNVRHAFALQQDMADQVRGKHVGVIDDVMTTGETLNEIAATLKRHGAVRVTNLVFARTPK